MPTYRRKMRLGEAFIKDLRCHCFSVRRQIHYFIVLALGLATLLVVLSYFSKSENNIDDYPRESAIEEPLRFSNHTGPVDTRRDPWKNVPQFQLFLRMSSYPRFVNEFQRWFLTSYKLFFPPNRVRSSLVVALDGENRTDRKQGAVFKKNWPYPKVCFLQPAPRPSVYMGFQRYRMYWDQFYPDKCIDAEYVGYIDSDVMFFSVVTPQSLFENGKPIVNARIGLANNICWPLVTQLLLGHQQVLQCMSYFPIIIKVAHIVELRKYIAKRMKTTFDEAFTRALEVGQECLNQFCVFCNYVWLFHRDEYRFHLQMMPNGKWDGELGRVPSMVSLEYLEKEVTATQMVPKPRVVLHARHLQTKSSEPLFGLDLLVPPASTALELILKESLCYNGGFRLCPKGCKEFNRNGVFYYLFVFEWFDWNWDKRCLREQKKYLKEVRSVLQYYQQTGQPVLGVYSSKELCKRIA